jgi:hypothetical protein
MHELKIGVDLIFTLFSYLWMVWYEILRRTFISNLKFVQDMYDTIAWYDFIFALREWTYNYFIVSAFCFFENQNKNEEKKYKIKLKRHVIINWINKTLDNELRWLKTFLFLSFLCCCQQMSKKARRRRLRGDKCSSCISIYTTFWSWSFTSLFQTLKVFNSSLQILYKMKILQHFTIQ